MEKLLLGGILPYYLHYKMFCICTSLNIYILYHPVHLPSPLNSSVFPSARSVKLAVTFPIMQSVAGHNGREQGFVGRELQHSATAAI